jgi:endonuclease/exonuclease/phosphatase family metal-dependent hydrolase
VNIRTAYSVRVLRFAFLLFAASIASALQQSGPPSPACRTDAAGMTSVRWVRPPAESDRVALDAWCTTVGRPVVIEAPARTAEEGLDSLVIVSWNVHVGRGDVVTLVDSLRAGHLTGGRPARHFVLLLQEVHRAGLPLAAHQGDVVPGRIRGMPPSGMRLDVVETARSLGLSLFYAPSMLNGIPTPEAAEDRGNAILATRSISEPVAIELPFESQRRVAVAVSMHGTRSDGNAWHLQLCSAHLDNHTAWPRIFASFGSGRLRQAHFLAEALPTGPTVLGGDFNTWMLPFLERSIAYMHERFPETEEIAPGTTYSRKILPDRRVDYLFFRFPGGGKVPYRRLENRFASDHHPLIAVVPLAALSK